MASKQIYKLDDVVDMQHFCRYQFYIKNHAKGNPEKAKGKIQG